MITQVSLAEKLGVSATYLRMLLFGTQKPSAKMCIRLEQHSGIPKEDWMSLTKEELHKKLEAIVGPVNRGRGGKRLRIGHGLSRRMGVLESKMDSIIELLTERAQA